MNITGISTNCTPIRKTPNFRAIWVDKWVKNQCGLTDYDIAAINAKCPRNLDVDVIDFGTDGHHIEVARANIYYNGKRQISKDFDVYYNCSDSYKAKQSSKRNFMSCIDNILNRYNN